MKCAFIFLSSVQKISARLASLRWISSGTPLSPTYIMIPAKEPFYSITSTPSTIFSVKNTQYHKDPKFSDWQVWANCGPIGAVWSGFTHFGILSASFGCLLYGKTTLFKFLENYNFFRCPDFGDLYSTQNDSWGLFQMKKYRCLWKQSTIVVWRWLGLVVFFFNPVGGCLLWKCNSVGGCPSQKCNSLGILCSYGILWVVWV